MSSNTHADSRPAAEEKTDERKVPVAPTSLDVARLANVSRATVSYVLNNVPNSRISEATKERVRAAAAQLGYVPHEMASSLRAGRNDLVLLPFFDWPYNASSIGFLQALALQVDALGYAVMLRLFRHSDKASIIRKIASFHPVGMIVPANELSEADVEILSRNRVRAILAYAYGEPPQTPTPAVVMDFARLGECAAEHLLSRGHRHIAVVVPKDPRIVHMGRQRLAGLERIALPQGATVTRLDLDYEPRQAAAVAAQWREGPRPTAVFTYNDEYALLLLSALQDVGLTVPGDVALVGCDDLPSSQLLRPRLTSIAIDPEAKMTGTIAAHFHALIQGQAPTPSLIIRPPCRLIVRESS